MQITDFPELPAMLQQAVMRALTAQHDGNLFEADRLYQQIVRRRPLHPLLANTAAGFFLLKGDFPAAWALFEQRLSLPYYTHRPFAKLAAPMWDGAPIPNKRLLIFADMGLGDTILMARFLPWVQDRVGGLALQVNKGTSAFWRYRLPGAEISEIDDPLPACDFRINMFCLPRLFGADAATMPPPGYIASRPEERDFWRARLGGDGGLKVGISWQGNPDHVRDFERSVPFAALQPLIEDTELKQAGVRFFSVQMHHGRDAVHAAAAQGLIEDLGGEMEARDALEASAALVDELDLVIAVDSAFANLAAAMDRPVWLPTYKVPDWRWWVYPDLDLAHPQIAPWYRSHVIYSCAVRQEWAPVVASLRDDLAKLARQG